MLKLCLVFWKSGFHYAYECYPYISNRQEGCPVVAYFIGCLHYFLRLPFLLKTLTYPNLTLSLYHIIPVFTNPFQIFSFRHSHCQTFSESVVVCQKMMVFVLESFQRQVCKCKCISRFLFIRRLKLRK